MTPLYKVSIHSLEHHLFRVQLQIPANQQDSTILWLPNWLPGSYKIRDFARNIIEFAATCSQNPLKWQKLDKHRWQVENQGQAFEVEYLVYAFERSVRTCHLDESHAYFNGSSLFLCPQGTEQGPFEVQLMPPEAAITANWQLYTGLPTQGPDQRGFGLYRAESYAQLIDCPVEMAAAEVVMFSVEEIPHRLVITGSHFGDLQSIAQSLKAICTYQCQLFGELPVKDQYLFLLQLVARGYGGLEHSNSTSLLCSRQDLENPNPEQPSDSYLQFLALCSHEYFHLWNGKRIAPSAYLHPDLSREVHSGLLWLVEGVTSYYDELTLVRAGVMDEAAYLKMQAKNLGRYLRGKGRLRQSLVESSFDAWTKFYQQDENAPNAIVSYYTKGGLVVMMLDLALRQRSRDSKSFDDVLRHLWQHFGKPGLGIEEDAMADIILEATGIDLGPELERWTRTAAPIEEEMTALLATMGIELQLLPPANQQGETGHKDKAPAPPWLGIGYKDHALGLEVTQVHEDSPAAQATLAAGDLLLALGGHRLTSTTLERLLAHLAPHQETSISFFRDDRLMQRTIALRPGPAFVAELRVLDLPEASDRRHSWLQPTSSVS